MRIGFLPLLFAMSRSIADGHRPYERTTDDTGPIVSISIYYNGELALKTPPASELIPWQCRRQWIDLSGESFFGFCGARPLTLVHSAARESVRNYARLSQLNPRRKTHRKRYFSCGRVLLCSNGS